MMSIAGVVKVRGCRYVHSPKDHHADRYLQDDWIKARIANEDYTNVSEYVRDLIRRDQERARALKMAIDEGLANRCDRQKFTAFADHKRVRGLSQPDRLGTGDYCRPHAGAGILFVMSQWHNCDRSDAESLQHDAAMQFMPHD